MATIHAPMIERRQLPDRRTNAQSRTSGGIIALDYIAMALMIIGGLNWAMVGMFQVDVVSTLFGPASLFTQLIDILVGVAALWGVYLLGKLASNNGRS